MAHLFDGIWFGFRCRKTFDPNGRGQKRIPQNQVVVQRHFEDLIQNSLDLVLGLLFRGIAHIVEYPLNIRRSDVLKIHLSKNWIDMIGQLALVSSCRHVFNIRPGKDLKPLLCVLSEIVLFSHGGVD